MLFNVFNIFNAARGQDPNKSIWSFKKSCIAGSQDLFCQERGKNGRVAMPDLISHSFKKVGSKSLLWAGRSVLSRKNGNMRSDSVKKQQKYFSSEKVFDAILKVHHNSMITY